MTRLDELLNHWRDDSLAPEELNELVSLLEAPEHRRALVQDFWLAQAAGEALGLVGCGRAESVRSPIASGRAGGVSPLSGAVVAESPQTQGAYAPRSPKWFLALAASLLLLVGAALWFCLPRSAEAASVARLVEVSGEVEVLTPSGSVVVARAGQPLYPGQTLRTGDDSFAAIEYPDATRLELHADTVLRIADSGRVVFSGGVVRAEVTHRQQGKALVLAAPQVEVRASESRILIACSTQQTTRVDVEQGNAEVVRQSDGRSVEMEGGSYTVATMDLEPPVVRSLPPPLTQPIRSIDFRAARTVAYAADGEPLMAMPRGLRFAKGKARQATLLNRKGEGHSAISRDGNVVVAGGGNQIGVWTVEPFGLRKQWTAANLVQGLAVNGDGSRLVSLDQKRGVVTLHDAATGKEIHRLTAGVRFSRGLAISGDGNTVAVGCLLRAKGEWTVQLFLAESGKKRTALTGLDSPPRLLAFSPDGTRLAVAGKDGFRLFDVETRTLQLRVSSHEQPLWSLAFSPDGKTLAGGSGDGQVWLWQTETGTQERQIKAGSRAVAGLAFSPDGMRLLTCGQAMPVQEWELTAGSRQ